MKYSTYWSILDSPSFTISTRIIGLVVAFIAIIAGVLIYKFKKNNAEGDKSMLLFGVGTFGFLGIGMFFLLTFVYPDNSRIEMIKALNSPTANRVKGKISNFQRKYRRQEIIESFTVDSVQFAYGRSSLGGFSSFSEVNNNVIYDGQNVRITYTPGSLYGDHFNTMQKIEIGK